MIWPYINNTPVFYWSGHQPLPQAAAQIAISNPWAAKDLTWSEPERAVILLEAHHIGQNLQHLFRPNSEIVFIFTELPRDFQLLQLQSLIARHSPIRIALPTHHNSSVESLLLSAPRQILKRICFYSVQTSPTSTEYYLFRNFIQFELPAIVRILNSRGVEYKFFSLPRRYRDPREWIRDGNWNLQEAKDSDAGLLLRTKEARKVFGLLTEGRELTKEHLPPRKRIDPLMLRELSTLELIFHKIIVPTEALPREHAWWELGLQDAFVEREGARSETLGSRALITSQIKVMSLLTFKLGAFARWKVTALIVHSWWFVMAPLKRLWGKLWWRPRAMAGRAAAILAAVWGKIWWRPKAIAASVWGRISWRIPVLFQRILGRCHRVWGNYWWRPVAKVRGLWNSWQSLWQRPKAWVKRLFHGVAVGWGRVYWLPKVAFQRAVGRVGRLVGYLRRAWGQIWWRPLVFARSLPGRALWVWGQVWWRPLVAASRFRAFMIRTYYGIVRALHALRKPLRIATFPVRKIYYMARYQYQKRILGTWNGDEI